MYAVGPFTRIVFSIQEGTLLLMTYHKWPEGQRGDLVNTIVTVGGPYAPRAVDIFNLR